jgi:hypothetical protein
LQRLQLGIPVFLLTPPPPPFLPPPCFLPPAFTAKTNFPLENYWHLLSQRPEAAALTAAATGAGLGGEGGEGAEEALQLLQQDGLQEVLGGNGDSGERLPRGSKRRAAAAR